MKMYWPIAVIVLANVLYNVFSKATDPNINPFASLTVTYLIAAAASALLYFLLNKDANLLAEYRHLNWSSIALGITIVGLEAGSIYMYKAGWNVSTGPLLTSSIVIIMLMLVGYIFYREAITLKKVIGMFVCLFGIYLISK